MPICMDPQGDRGAVAGAISAATSSRLLPELWLPIWARSITGTGASEVMPIPRTFSAARVAEALTASQPVYRCLSQSCSFPGAIDLHCKQAGSAQNYNRASEPAKPDLQFLIFLMTDIIFSQRRCQLSLDFYACNWSLTGNP
jgi:hypothetical protein